MKRLFFSIILSSSTVVILSSCAKLNRPKDISYSSREKAQLACKSWKDKGGTWELKVDDLSILTEKKKNISTFPLKVESKSRKRENDLNYPEENNEVKVYFPLFSSAKDRSIKNKDIIIESTDGGKWLKYDRRLCTNKLNGNNTILGEEYIINTGKNTRNSGIPLLRIEKSFPFDE